MKNALLALFFLGFLVGCSDKEEPFQNLPPPEFGPMAMRVGPQVPDGPHENVAEAPAVSGKIVSGQVDIDQNLVAKLSAGPKILFVMAKSPQGGPPLAVKRLVVEKFPVAFSVGEQDVMTPGTSLEGQLKIIARLDSDGSAGPAQPGDLEGTAAKPVKLGTQNLRVVLNKAY